jgi:hypothetical protein
VSPYSYVGGDPVNRNDPSGRSWGDNLNGWIDRSESDWLYEDALQGTQTPLARAFFKVSGIHFEDNLRAGVAAILNDKVEMLQMQSNRISNEIKKTVLNGINPSEIAKDYAKSPTLTSGVLSKYFTQVARLSKAVQQALGKTPSGSIQLNASSTYADKLSFVTKGGDINFTLRATQNEYFDKSNNILSSAIHEAGHINLNIFTEDYESVDYEREHMRVFEYQLLHGAAHYPGTSDKFKIATRRALIESQNYGWSGQAPTGLELKINSTFKALGLNSQVIFRDGNGKFY